MSRTKLSATLAAIFVVVGTGLAVADDVGQGEKVVVSPPQGKVGTRFNISCKDFPQPASSDTVYIVTAGSPDVDPNSPAASDVKILWKDYAVNCYQNSGRFLNTAGPFAPGNYEARFATTLYNNDNRVEISTRTPFSVK